jgi:hypothetical protein
LKDWSTYETKFEAFSKLRLIGPPVRKVILGGGIEFF